ncbi:MAG TPA: hypothetical protein DCM23_02435 [Firmicutes bacterium]|jgi:16S rRNA (uracil1498-N3)-methyltransferase|nr:hypothetical protein [Bacillota bacterium]
MTRYFATINAGRVVLTTNDKHHLLHVMRSRIGDKLEIVFNAKLFVAEIQQLKPLIIEVIDEINETEDPLNLTLIYALPKGEKLDLVIQKATELGVERIILFMSKRSVARWSDEDVARKLARLQTIAKEASAQAKRLSIPSLKFISSFEEVLKLQFDQKLIASEFEVKKPPFAVKISIHDDVSIIIGPEGGFALDEVKDAIAHGYRPISLGNTILRSETAAISAIAILGYIKNHALI